MTFDPADIRLDGRVAVVTGAARGLGAAIAANFARFGADLAICDRDADGLAATAATIEAEGRRAVTAVIDVRKDGAVREHVDAALAAFGRIDVLVNNAAGTYFLPFTEFDDRRLQSMIDENFNQVCSFIRACAPHMPEGGSIVNVTSIEAWQAAPSFSVYSAMKAAVESLTKSLALELGERGIRVNSIAPDAIHTPGDDGLAAEVASAAVFEPTYTPPLGHLGDPDDAAGVCLFLASPLSRFVNGVSIGLDGGNRAAGGWRRRPAGEAGFRT
jgi:NAD(P)-dependent dehydrogenase (short-subunit alcohol dehydrogenase family)